LNEFRHIIQALSVSVSVSVQDTL